MIERGWLLVAFGALSVANGDLSAYDRNDQDCADVTARWHEQEAHKYVYRMEIADEFLWGDGIEIGAKNSPLFTQKTTHARVKLVDHMSTPDLLRKYNGTSQKHQEWAKAMKRYPVERVDDAETLETFADASLDFVIANHVLEVSVLQARGTASK